MSEALPLTEAAQAVGLTVKSLRRRMADEQFPNARMEPTVRGVERWVIPVDDLRAAGLSVDLDRIGEGDPDVEELREQVIDLERRLAVAEAIADERGRALDDLRLALGILSHGAAGRS